MHKLDSPKRIAELKPEQTLHSLGLNSSDVFCDIGAGTGVFTLPAARISGAQTYAVDVSEDMLAIIADKCAAQGIVNVTCVNASSGVYPIADSSVDLAMMCTVFHELADPPPVLAEAHRVLKPTGRLAVIEFLKKRQPFGPSLETRVGEDELTQQLEQYGFVRTHLENLGDSLYMAVFAQA